MSTFEESFNTSVLDVIVPISSVGFPSQDPPANPAETSEWVETLQDEAVDRKTAFFDENLDFLLTLRFESNELSSTTSINEPELSSDDTSEGESLESSTSSESEHEDTPQIPSPPTTLLSFLSHLQISYEATYISSLPVPSDLSHQQGGAPPRTLSIAKSKAASLLPTANAHPSIIPPNTPHPLPATGRRDRQYVQSQGTLFCSGIWGEKGVGVESKGEAEGFVLGWSKKEKIWIAVYRMVVQITFVDMKEDNPLLCLTVSTTLRAHALTMTPARKPLAALIEAAGGLGGNVDPGTPTNANGDDDDDDDDDDEGVDITGLEEVNLLGNLSGGPTFSESLNLPSIRLGPSVRKQVFSLPPIPSTPPATPHSSSSISTTTSASTITRGVKYHYSSHPTLRKSFRKTMEVASAIRVRMRTVFVPYYIPGGDTSLLLSSQKKRSSSSVSEEDEDEDEDEDAMPESIYARELREAGNEEHTVILCVEVEHAGESRNYYQLEDIKVDVGGQGASTRLVTWGTGSPSNPTITSTPSTTSKERVFPLVLSPKEQYNLLYAVSFMRSPEMDEFSLARGKSLPGKPVVQELQRPVVIVISGRPVELVMKGNETHGRSGSTGIGTLRPLEGLPPPPSRISGKKKGQTSDTKTEEEFIYPTHTFPSRWNTTVDLAKQLQSHNTYNSSSSNMGLAGIVKGSERVDDDGMNDALPTPASPFPPSVLRSSFPSARSSSSRAGSSFQGGGGGNGRGDTGSGIIRSTTPLSMSMSASSTPKRSGTPTPTAQAQGGGGAGPASVAGNRKFTVSSMDAMGEMSAATTMTKGGNPLSPVNYKSKTSMLNPANQRDTYMQSGSQSQSQGQGGQQQGYQSFASVMGGAGGGGMGLSMSSQSQSQSQSQSSSTSSGGSSSLNPILGTLNTQQLQPQQQQRGLGQSYILPSVTFQQYAKSPTTYGPLSPPLPPVPSQAGFSFSGIPSPSTSSHRMSGIGFIGGGGGGGGGGSGHGYEDSLSGDISLDFATFGGNNQEGGMGMGIPNPPRTPAYPAFPSSPAFPPTPNWQGPINNYYAGVGVGGGGGGGGGGVGGNQAVLIGPSVEIRRDKMLSSSFPGSSLSGSVSVGSPGGFSSLVGGQVHQEGFSSLGGDDAPGFGNGNGNGKGEGEPVVVSVGLLADMSRGRKDGLKDVMGKIYPLDRFTLDIFVFNQSSWTRRFEVSYPDRRKLRKGKALVGNLVGGTAVLGGVAVAGGIGGGGGDGEMTGVLPLENRVRVGPLLPSTCQSVRMDFLALTPGVHSIDTLTLIDIQTGYTMNLRHVIDIVVHEHQVPNSN